MMAKRLTYDDVADIFDAETGQCARVMPMATIKNWAKTQSERIVRKEDGYFYLKADTNKISKKRKNYDK